MMGNVRVVVAIMRHEPCYHSYMDGGYGLKGFPSGQFVGQRDAVNPAGFSHLTACYRMAGSSFVAGSQNQKIKIDKPQVLSPL